MIVMEQHEYRSRPRLAALAAELEILNAELIRLGVSDRARLLRLKLYAQDYKRFESLPPDGGVRLLDEDAERPWLAQFRDKRLGPFASPMEAHRAYREAHVAHYGNRSQYHPDFVPRHIVAQAEQGAQHLAKLEDDIAREARKQQLYEAQQQEARGRRKAREAQQQARVQPTPHHGPLPQGVKLQGNRYVARIKANGEEIHLGSFLTADEAHRAFVAKHVEVHGSRSPWFNGPATDSGQLPRGVQRTPTGRFRADIRINRKTTSLGTYDTPQEAHEAFKRAHVEHHGERSPWYFDDEEAVETSLEDIMRELLIACDGIDTMPQGAGVKCLEGAMKGERTRPVEFSKTESFPENHLGAAA